MGTNDFRDPNNQNNNGGSNSSSNNSNSSHNSSWNSQMPPMFAGANIQDDDEDPDLAILVDYNEKFKDAKPIIFRDSEVLQLNTALISKEKSNALLIGPAGVGKTKLVEELARLIENKDISIPKQLHNYTVYELPLGSLVSGTMFRGQLESKITKIIDFAKENKVILFIDEIHELNNETSMGGESVGQLFKPAMARGEIKVIGATTTNEVLKIDGDAALKRRFSRIIVPEFTYEQTEEILKMVRKSYEEHYENLFSITDEICHYIIEKTIQNESNQNHRPDYQLTVLDRSMAEATISIASSIATLQSGQNNHLLSLMKTLKSAPLTHQHVDKTIQKMVNGSQDKPEANAEALANNFKEFLIGQDNQANEIINAYRRKELGLFELNKPLSFLLAGPSGTGKTQSAKILSKTLFDTKPIIVNMTEYTTHHSIEKLIGLPNGYRGQYAEKPFDVLHSNPYQVILLDEFEKGHELAKQLFMSVLDEGQLKEANGRVLDFSKSIILATTNAGRDALKNSTFGFGNKDGVELTKQSLTKALEQDFKPEVIARFTHLIGFNPINASMFDEIMVNYYNHEREKIVAKFPQYDSLLPKELTEDEIKDLHKNYVPETGARNAETAIRSHIENLLI